VLRVRINSLDDERILECGVEADGDRTCTSHVRGARTLSRCTWRGVRLLGTRRSASGSLWRSQRGRWTDAHVQRGQLVEMFTAVPTGDIAFGTIELAARTGTMDVGTLPCGASCQHADDTHGRAYTTSVRAHLKASPLWTRVPVGPRRTRRRMGYKR
jgi:hypothetical protein